MLQLIQRKLLGLKVVIDYLTDDDKPAEAFGTIEAIWVAGEQIYVAVVPEGGYFVSGPLHDCRIDADDEDEDDDDGDDGEQSEEVPPVLTWDGVGPEQKEG